MFISVFDIFKIGIGPSSSHTMGPMLAAGRFLEALRATGGAEVVRLGVRLHGSLAFTGKGHGTDRAVLLGLLGLTPETLDPAAADELVAAALAAGRITPAGLPPLAFALAEDLVFDYGPPLPEHANGLVLSAYAADGSVRLVQTYFSIGGGFVVEAAEWQALKAAVDQPDTGPQPPYPFASAAEMLAMAAASGQSIVQMKRANELAMRSRAELDDGLDRIWAVMAGCLARGLQMEGQLPGGLQVRRRAKPIRQQLEAELTSNSKPPHQVNDWLAVYAMAVNEENAAGGRVVTAPTNGAAGVIPAVIRYYLEFCPGARREDVRDFLLAAAAIGGLIKHNASISGAEVGCQGEVGSASAMAAAGLCAVLGGSNEQIENAAEIALEHHLGMTCDPIKGLVQVPCIERNGFGAVKAVTAASLALKGDGQHIVPLDRCIETMRQTGLDMSTKYKETSTGGLAVNVVEC